MAGWRRILPSLFLLLLLLGTLQGELLLKDLQQAYTALGLQEETDPVLAAQQTRLYQAASEVADLRGQMITHMDRLTSIRERYQAALQLYESLRGETNDMNRLIQKMSNPSPAGPTVIVTTVTAAYVPLAKNFLCYLRALEPEIKVLMWALDDQAYRELEDWSPNVYRMDTDKYTALKGLEGSLSEENTRVPLDQDSVGFHRILLARTRFAQKVLEAGYNVVLCDVDQVWLSNPLLHLQAGEIMSMHGKAPDGVDHPVWLSSAFLFLPNLPRVVEHWQQFIQVYEQFVVSNGEAKGAKYSLKGAESLLLNGMFSLPDEGETDQPLLDPLQFSRDLFADGEHYFHHKRPQMKNIQPVVVHCDLMDGMLAKRTLMKRRAMWILSEHADQCPIAPASDRLLQSSLDAPEERPRITIKLLTYNRPQSLLRALVSLREADYQGDRVPLDIFIDLDLAASAFPAPVVQIADEFYWPHGSKRIHYRAQRGHITNQWMEAWFPSVETGMEEFALIIEDDMEVSRFYYRWLVAATQAYYLSKSTDSRRLFGISLARAHLNVGRHPQPFRAEGEGQTSVRYQLPSTWAVLWGPQQWKHFRLWYDFALRRNQATMQHANLTGPAWSCPHAVESELLPYMAGSVAVTAWYQQSRGTLFLAWLVRYAYEQGVYTVYPNLPRGFTLAVNHQEAGVFQTEAKGPDGVLLHHEEELPSSVGRDLFHMPMLESLPLYDLCGQRLDQPELPHPPPGPVVCT